MKYTTPDLKLVLIAANDVITTSNSQGGGNSGTETPDDSLWG